MAEIKPVLLVLESDAAVQDSLKFSLEVEGFEVRTYASPDALLSDGNLPDHCCLIVHYHFPEIDGLEVINRLRKRRGSIPAIVMTGRPYAKIRERASAAGVPLVEKPVRGKELIECIHKVSDGWVDSK